MIIKASQPVTYTIEGLTREELQLLADALQYRKGTVSPHSGWYLLYTPFINAIKAVLGM